MQTEPYVFFNGQCEAALKFYEQCLGAKTEAKLKYEGTPAAEEVPANWRDKILHAKLTVGETTMLASDAPPGHYKEPQGFSIALQVKDPAEAERVFYALAEKGTVTLPLQQTFWAPRFGMLVDRFGVPWMVNSEGAK